MIHKQLIIGRAISAVDALRMHAPEFALKEINRAFRNEPKVSYFKKLHQDIIEQNLHHAEADLRDLETDLYSFQG